MVVCTRRTHCLPASRRPLLRLAVQTRHEMKGSGAEGKFGSTGNRRRFEAVPVSHAKQPCAPGKEPEKTQCKGRSTWCGH